MCCVDVLNERIEKRGIPVSELARRTDISYEVLLKSLHKKRELRAGEFLACLRELELTFEDFDD